MLCIFQDWSQYGIDCRENVTLNTYEETLAAVVIPEVRNPLSERDFEELQAQINPIAHDEGYGIDLYQQACMFATGRVHV